MRRDSATVECQPRVLDLSTMPITKDSAPTAAPPPGGTPRGNTFLSLAASCWWAWALKYLAGIVPVKTRDALNFGSAYHAVLEGQDIEAIRAWAPDFVDAAKRLADRRLKEGPALPEAHAIEKTHSIFDGLMTSKPDREENGAVRDFKTAMMFTKHDDAYWDVEPGIIGEMVAQGVRRAVVDVMRKENGRSENGSSASSPNRIFHVELTDKKEEALRLAVEDFWRQLLWRLERVQKAKGDRSSAVRAAFPKQLKSCVGKYGLCDYYDRCWGKGLEMLLYKKKEGFDHSWATGSIKLPGEKVAKMKATEMEQLGKYVESMK